MNGKKFILIFFGIFVMWLAIFGMFELTYEHMISVSTAAVNGGSYYPTLLGGPSSSGWEGATIILWIVVSTLLISFGLTLDKDDGAEPPPPPP